MGHPLSKCPNCGELADCRWYGKHSGPGFTSTLKDVCKKCAYSHNEGEPVKAKTYDEWKEIGYQVKRGEKCIGFNAERKPIFGREQVEERGDFDKKRGFRFEKE